MYVKGHSGSLETEVNSKSYMICPMVP